MVGLACLASTLTAKVLAATGSRPFGRHAHGTTPHANIASNLSCSPTPPPNEPDDMKVLIACAWVLLALAPATVFADNEPPTLDELLERHFQARGGLAAIRALDSYRASGSFEMGGARASYVMTAKRPGKLRMDFLLNGVSGSQAIAGDDGWQLMPFSGITRPTPMTPEETRNFKDQADMDGPLVDWQAKGHRVEFLGQDQVDGDLAWQISIDMDSGVRAVVWIDAASWIDRRWQVSTQMNGQPTTVTIHYGDHRKVGDLLLPHRIEQQVHGLPAAQLFTVDRYELDLEIDDRDFRIPSSDGETGVTATDGA